MRFNDDVRKIFGSIDPDDFDRTLIGVFEALYPGVKTVDGMLTDHVETKDFCRMIRSHFHLRYSRKRDRFIARRLLNLRKKGLCRLSDREVA